MVSPRVETPPSPIDDRRRTSQPSSPVRWQRMRVTLLQAQVIDRDATRGRPRAAARARDMCAAKASAFGGRILELGPSSVKAAFGLDLVEDAACHAAHAAFAVQRAVGASPAPLPGTDRDSHRGDARRAHGRSSGARRGCAALGRGPVGRSAGSNGRRSHPRIRRGEAVSGAPIRRRADRVGIVEWPGVADRRAR